MSIPRIDATNISIDVGDLVQCNSLRKGSDQTATRARRVCICISKNTISFVKLYVALDKQVVRAAAACAHTNRLSDKKYIIWTVYCKHEIFSLFTKHFSDDPPTTARNGYLANDQCSTALPPVPVQYAD